MKDLTAKEIIAGLSGRGWSHKRIAFAVGATVTTVSRWNRNVSQPHERELKKLTKLLKHSSGITTDQLREES